VFFMAIMACSITSLISSPPTSTEAIYEQTH
jgi:hypothetical protein